MARDPGEEPLRLGFLLVPGFTMIAFFLAIETLRIANRAAGRTLYRWHVYSEDGKPVPASNGMTILPEAALAAAGRLPLLFVCAGFEAERLAGRPLLDGLRRLARHGARLGGLDTGAFLLAKAGLLDGHRATLHWEEAPLFRERYPEVALTESLYEIDRERVTCAGGLATVDLMLALVAEDFGPDLAARAADLMIRSQARPASEYQRKTAEEALRVRDARLTSILRLMESHLEEPLDAAALQAAAGVSKRQLQRLFRRHLGDTPMGYYLKLRLQHAWRLLYETDLPVLEVELACGFDSASAFSRAYKRCFGRSPRADRKRLREKSSLGTLLMAPNPVAVDSAVRAERG